MRQAPRSPLSFKLQRVANVPEHPPPSSRLMSCAHIANRQLSRIIGARLDRGWGKAIERYAVEGENGQRLMRIVHEFVNLEPRPQLELVADNSKADSADNDRQDRSNPKPDRGHHDLPQAQQAAAGLRGVIPDNQLTR